MTSTSSKLDYLKKYMSKSSSVADGTADVIASAKKKKKKRPKEDPSSAFLTIRDETADLPAPKAKKARRLPLPDDLPDTSNLIHEGDEDAPALAEDHIDPALLAEIRQRGGADIPLDEEDEGVARRFKQSQQARKEPPPPSAQEERAAAMAQLFPGGRKAVIHEEPSVKKEREYPFPVPTKEEPDDDDDDLSPPRRPPPAPSSDRDGDLSPPRRPPADQDGDLTPPRRPVVIKTEPDEEGDLSPPRRPMAADNDGDLSPPRKPMEDADGGLTPPRRQMVDDEGDLDLERPVQGGEGENEGEGRERMADGAVAGLVSGRELREEAEKLRQRQEAEFAAADAEALGKGAAVRYRDKEGREIGQKEWEKLNQKKKKRPREPAQHLEWGAGLVQRDEKKRTEEEERVLGQQPLARYEIDSSYDAVLRERERWDDPLRGKLDKADNEDDNKDTTTKTQTAVRKARPKCRFPAPPNRYGISPGYRWDGVVRGNGFEDKFLQAKNRRKWEAEQGYKWSIEEM